MRYHGGTTAGTLGLYKGSSTPKGLTVTYSTTDRMFGLSLAKLHKGSCMEQGRPKGLGRFWPHTLLQL